MSEDDEESSSLSSLSLSELSLEELRPLSSLSSEELLRLPSELELSSPMRDPLIVFFIDFMALERPLGGLARRRVRWTATKSSSLSSEELLSLSLPMKFFFTDLLSELMALETPLRCGLRLPLCSEAATPAATDEVGAAAASTSFLSSLTKLLGSGFRKEDTNLSKWALLLFAFGGGTGPGLRMAVAAPPTAALLFFDGGRGLRVVAAAIARASGSSRGLSSVFRIFPLFWLFFFLRPSPLLDEPPSLPLSTDSIMLF